MGGLALTIGILAALYCFLIAPNVTHRKLRRPELTAVPYAHRGLHGEGIPENSLAAFRRAVEKGYGIELDVRLTHDLELAVFHDATLERMCGKDWQISRLTMEEIRSLRLAGSEEGIPTLEEVLSLVGGRVPLIVEMKSDQPGDTALAQLLYKRLRRYAGPCCVESFDPMLLRWYKKHAPAVVRGQLAFDPAFSREYPRRPAFLAAGHLVFNFLSRPDFVAYAHETDRNLSFRVMRSLFRPMLAAWTVRSAQDFEKLQPFYDMQIFEGFEPSLFPNFQDEKE